jgi:hypothetical protein
MGGIQWCVRQLPSRIETMPYCMTIQTVCEHDIRFYLSSCSIDTSQHISVFLHLVFRGPRNARLSSSQLIPQVCPVKTRLDCWAACGRASSSIFKKCVFPYGNTRTEYMFQYRCDRMQKYLNFTPVTPSLFIEKRPIDFNVSIFSVTH